MNRSTTDTSLYLADVLRSKDGTKKFIWGSRDSRFIETVLVDLEYRNVPSVICVSTQLGCQMGCVFCRTGEKFCRNLDSSEITGQITGVLRHTANSREDSVETFEISFMAMGEPLMNWRALESALLYLNMNHSSEIEATVSTCGIVPGIYQLAELRVDFILDLQISLHSICERTRTLLMPVNGLYSIDKVLQAADYYARARDRKVCVNFLLLEGVNDSAEEARQLARMLDPSHFYVKLSELNSSLNSSLRSSPHGTFARFKAVLEGKGILTKVFRSKGCDIGAGCGELASLYTASPRSVCSASLE